MDRSPNRPKIQHYVPQFLLRRFADDEGSISVYDKAESRRFSTGTAAVAAEKFFYDVEVEAGIVTIEEGLADLEGLASTMIQGICERGTLKGLSDGDRASLAYFIAVQGLRTQHVRANLSNMTEQLHEKIKRSLPSKDIDLANALPMFTAQHAKRSSMALILDGAPEIAEIIYKKPWILLHAPEGDLFLGDNPMTMHNNRDHGFYGNLGYAVEGVEIHSPLDPYWALYVMCPTEHQGFVEAQANLKLLKHANKALWRKLRPRRDQLAQILSAAANGDSIDLRPENVERENALQVRYAGRWVFSQGGDFELVERMITDDETYRSGPFGTVA